MRLSKLGRNMGHRRALLRNLLTSLILNDSIETTESRAESLKRLADKYISLAKKGDLASRRRALAFFLDEDAVKKLFDVLAPRYKDRQGGYVQVIKAGNRRGDGAPTAIVRLV